jgi:hypothetical protein
MRREIIDTFFPDALPALICRLLSRWESEAKLDHRRFETHVASIAPRAGAFLASGSTGDGWEMEGGESAELAELLRGVLERHRRTLQAGVPETGTSAPERIVESAAEVLEADSLLHDRGYVDA